MKWRGRRQSSNIEDRRGRRMPRKTVGGGLGILLIALVVWLLGGDPGAILNFLQTGQQSAMTYQPSAQEDEMAQFVGVVLADTEDVWDLLFRQMGRQYRAPKLVLYNDVVRSACGLSQAATGPFYCPADEKIYIDLNFMHELQRRFHAPGDFAVAYIIAHEVGHHVQNLLGITDQVATLRSQMNQRDYNKISVRTELQADFLAGVWAHHAQRLKKILEQGDLEEALNAASAVGDDRIQKATQGRIVPDAFTHGSSQQRMHWFRKGFETGDINQGDTFNAGRL